VSSSNPNNVNTMFGGPDWYIAFLIVLVIVAIVVAIIYVIAYYRRKKKNVNSTKKQYFEHEPVKIE
jgi:heme/copper-type cytochrome/quinol oxidase subunit 2